MARQLNFLSSGQIVATPLHTEVQRSYLEYAMSVIVGRALPDVRDGLKPVHRRILYAMHELGLTPDRPYRKCARVVGDVLGKYHPHGDQAVYDALVRMVQDFSSRYPLLAGHGNFGSVDNDPPAAMRYTETRLAPISHEAVLAEVSEATVDFIANFDNSQQEPVVLPAQLPMLLLNGCSGIAVGMATNVPPHNMGEVIDGLIAMIDQPSITIEELMEYIPGPDFPTGGEIVGTEGIREAYTTGRGSIPVRGIAGVEEIPGGRGRQRRTAIVVTELPYQVNKAAWIEKVADLTNQGRLDGISDIRDESDRDGMRVVIELKREASPERILGNLYKLTPLQSNFGVILLALANGQPMQMSLKDILQHFLDFREETLTRQYSHDLERVEQRIHVLDGMLVALSYLDDVIDILRNAPDGTTAKITLQNQFDLTERQTDAILAMPLRRLTGLEQQNIQSEFEDLNQRRQQLQLLLSNRRELLKALKKELRSLKKKFIDDRRTRIQSDAEKEEESARIAQIVEEAETVEEEVVLEFTQRGYVRRLSPRSYKRQQAKQEELLGTWEEVDDPTLQVEMTTTQQTLLVFTRSGKAYAINVADIPPTPRNSRGTNVMTLLPNTVHENEEAIATQLLMPAQFEDTDLLLITHQGKIKRLPLSEFASMTARGLTALKLKEGDELSHVVLAQSGDQLVLATPGGRVLRFMVDDEQLPYMSRNSQGVSAVRLMKKERLAGCTVLQNHQNVLLVSAQGYAKRLPVTALRLGNRGDLGLQAIVFSAKTDTLIGIAGVSDHDKILLLSSSDRLIRCAVNTIKIHTKDDQGDRLVKLSRGEKIVSLVQGVEGSDKASATS
ncbi:MAG: DNA gyrase subunit A [Synechococcales cyanobacterium T60_A2020_003]|nr:DNA gyrase subunit A [Synechococcales cyanobacterium T60_A2020_003]